MYVFGMKMKFIINRSIGMECDEFLHFFLFPESESSLTAAVAAAAEVGGGGGDFLSNI